MAAVDVGDEEFLGVRSHHRPEHRAVGLGQVQRIDVILLYPDERPLLELVDAAVLQIQELVQRGEPITSQCGGGSCGTPCILLYYAPPTDRRPSRLAFWSLDVKQLLEMSVINETRCG